VVTIIRVTICSDFVVVYTEKWVKPTVTSGVEMELVKLHESQ